MNWKKLSLDYSLHENYQHSLFMLLDLLIQRTHLLARKKYTSQQFSNLVYSTVQNYLRSHFTWKKTVGVNVIVAHVREDFFTLQLFTRKPVDPDVIELNQCCSEVTYFTDNSLCISGVSQHYYPPVFKRFCTQFAPLLTIRDGLNIIESHDVITASMKRVMLNYTENGTSREDFNNLVQGSNVRMDQVGQVFRLVIGCSDEDIPDTGPRVNVQDYTRDGIATVAVWDPDLEDYLEIAPGMEDAAL